MIQTVSERKERKISQQKNQYILYFQNQGIHNLAITNSLYRKWSKIYKFPVFSLTMIFLLYFPCAVESLNIQFIDKDTGSPLCAAHQVQAGSDHVGGLTASGQTPVDGHLEEVVCCVDTMLIQTQLVTKLLNTPLA